MEAVGENKMLYERSLQADCIKRRQDLDMYNFSDLVFFETPWGSFNVYIKDTVDGKYLGQGWATLQMVFRQPVVTIEGVIPEALQAGIYNIAYASFGAIVTQVADNFNRPETKKSFFTAYQNEGCQVTKMGLILIDQTLIYFSTPSFETLKINVGNFSYLLASPELRTINIDNMERECFSAGGFSLNGIRVTEGQCGRMTNLPMIIVGAGVLGESAYLLDTFDNAILGNIDFIKIENNPLDFITDNLGNGLITNKFEDITL